MNRKHETAGEYVQRVILNQNFLYLIVFLVGLAYISGAFDPKPVPEDKVRTVDTNGSVETEISVSHINNDFDMLTTTHKIWAHGSLFNTYVTNDTIPALGSMSSTAEDAQGNSRSVLVPQDYELYITAK